jgi:hypothetical protein
VGAELIAKVIDERGSRTTGLIRYLFGPGRFNEHANPRVVAAWDSSFVRESSQPVLDAFEQSLLGREMEAPLRLHGLKPGEHVYHVPVSIEAEAGALSDDQWRQVAEEAADALGFTETDTRSAVPWVAVRHGLSEKGNDHIHFVAVLVRENGDRVDTWNDYARWAEVRHAAEDRWHLRSTRRPGGGSRGLKRGEIERAKREGRIEPERVQLARMVRAAAGAARSEAEFVHRLRRTGAIVRPRWATGGQRQVVGFSVALRPDDSTGRAPIFFGGGKLAGDLTLTELRDRWGDPDVADAADALRAWRPRGWRDLPTGRQVVRTQMRAQAWEIAGVKAAEVRAAIADLDPADAAAWAAVAGEAASTLGALSGRVELAHRDELRAAADALARAARRDRGVERRDIPEISPLVGVIRTATDAVLASRGGAIGVATLVMQIGRLVQAVQRANEVAGRAAEAQRSADAARRMLEFVRRTSRESERESRPGEVRRGPQIEFGAAPTRPDGLTKEEREHGGER